MTEYMKPANSSLKPHSSKEKTMSILEKAKAQLNSSPRGSNATLDKLVPSRTGTPKTTSSLLLGLSSMSGFNMPSKILSQSNESIQGIRESGRGKSTIASGSENRRGGKSSNASGSSPGHKSRFDTGLSENFGKPTLKMVKKQKVETPEPSLLSDDMDDSGSDQELKKYLKGLDSKKVEKEPIKEVVKVAPVSTYLKSKTVPVKAIVGDIESDSSSSNDLDIEEHYDDDDDVKVDIYLAGKRVSIVERTSSISRSSVGESPRPSTSIITPLIESPIPVAPSKVSLHRSNSSRVSFLEDKIEDYADDFDKEGEELFSSATSERFGKIKSLDAIEDSISDPFEPPRVIPVVEALPVVIEAVVPPKSTSEDVLLPVASIVPLVPIVSTPIQVQPIIEPNVAIEPIQPVQPVSVSAPAPTPIQVSIIQSTIPQAIPPTVPQTMPQMLHQNMPQMIPQTMPQMLPQIMSQQYQSYAPPTMPMTQGYGYGQGGSYQPMGYNPMHGFYMMSPPGSTPNPFLQPNYMQMPSYHPMYPQQMYYQPKCNGKHECGCTHHPISRPVSTMSTPKQRPRSPLAKTIKLVEKTLIVPQHVQDEYSADFEDETSGASSIPEELDEMTPRPAPARLQPIIDLSTPELSIIEEAPPISHEEPKADVREDSPIPSNEPQEFKPNFSSYLGQIHDKDLLNMTTLYPSMVVMDNFVRNHVQLLSEFVEMNRQMVQSQSYRSFQYTTLEDTRQFIASKRKAEMTFEQALKLVKEES